MTTTVECLEFLKKKKWLDLTHNVSAVIPYFSSFNSLSEKTLFTVEKDGFWQKNIAWLLNMGRILMLLFIFLLEKDI